MEHTFSEVKPVSVIIPTFNRIAMVREAVESVLAQNFRDFEVIVVDDGSTDGTATMLREYGRALQVITQANGGVSAARNRGIAASSGQFIAFLDSDDLWLPEKLAVQVSFMNAFPGAALCHTEEIWMRDGRRINPRQRHAKATGRAFSRLLRDCLISPSAVMIRREILLQAGCFNTELPVCEDYALWLELAREHEIHLIGRPLVVKRGGHSDQLSRTVWGLDRFRVRALKELVDRDGLADDEALTARKVLAEKCLILAAGSDRRGKHAEAAEYRALAGEYGP